MLQCLTIAICTSSFVPIGILRNMYEYVRDDSKFDYHINGKLLTIAKLDDQGNFHPYSSIENRENAAFISNRRPMRPFVNYPRSPSEYYYEFQSSHLVPGNFLSPGVFKPDGDRRIIHLKDYVLLPHGPRIRNLPGKFVHKYNWVAAAKKLIDDHAKQPQVIRSATTLPTKTEKYHLVLDFIPSGTILIERGNARYQAEIDRNGDTCFLKIAHVRDVKPEVLQKMTVLNRKPDSFHAKLAFEYRSGMLIPGDMDREGNFIPTLGAYCIPITSCPYRPEEMWIWNLPGKLKVK